MNLPIKCPICNKIMLTTYHESYSDSMFLTKSCNQNITHKLEFNNYNSNSDQVYSIKFSAAFFPKVYMVWNFGNKLFSVIKENNREFAAPIVNDMPVFNPDFSDYRKLIEKVKIYLTFC